MLGYKKTVRVISVIKEFLVSCGDKKVKSGINALIDVSSEEGGFLEEDGWSGLVRWEKRRSKEFQAEVALWTSPSLRIARCFLKSTSGSGGLCVRVYVWGCRQRSATREGILFFLIFYHIFIYLKNWNFWQNMLLNYDVLSVEVLFLLLQ